MALDFESKRLATGLMPGYNPAMELDRATRAVREALRHDATIAAAWIFGSVARGTAGSGSDVDLAVLRSSPTPKTFDDPALELGDRIARVLGRDVQVVEPRVRRTTSSTAYFEMAFSSSIEIEVDA